MNPAPLDDTLSWDSDEDHWELDECRFCKGPVPDPTETFCSAPCQLKWMERRQEELEYGADSSASPASWSVLAENATSSTPNSTRETPLSSANSSPAFVPVNLSSSVPALPLESYANGYGVERRRSFALRGPYGSSHNPVKKSFPSNYYQSTIGDRSSIPPLFTDKSVSLGIRKNSTEEFHVKQPGSEVKPSALVDEKPTDTTSTRQSLSHRGLWSWRRLSALM
jgi:hypothetical protein